MRELRPMMRYTESYAIGADQMDFLPRARQNQLRNIIVLAVVAILTIALFIFLPNTTGGKNVGAVGSMLVVAAFSFYLTYRKQQSLDLLMTTEYQNMLFSQAATLGSAFCLFARQDGSIVYASDGLKKIFPGFRYATAMALEGLFVEGHVNAEDRSRLLNAIANGTADSLAFPMRISDRETKDFVISVEPLPRPAGYSVIRGREFQEPRTGKQVLPAMLRATTPEKIDYLLRVSPMPLYTTDPYGRLEFVNPAMEALLEYAPGELAAGKLAVHKLFFELNGVPVPDDYVLAEHRGDAILQRKMGNLVKAALHQSLLRDAEGKPLGAVGSIIPKVGS